VIRPGRLNCNQSTSPRSEPFGTEREPQTLLSALGRSHRGCGRPSCHPPNSQHVIDRAMQRGLSDSTVPPHESAVPVAACAEPGVSNCPSFRSSLRFTRQRPRLPLWPWRCRFWSDMCTPALSEDVLGAPRCRLFSIRFSGQNGRDAYNIGERGVTITFTSRRIGLRLRQIESSTVMAASDAPPVPEELAAAGPLAVSSPLSAPWCRW